MACIPLARFAYSLSSSHTSAPLEPALFTATLGITKLITNSANGVGQLAFAGKIHLVAHILHIYVNDVGGGIVRRIPYLFGKGRSRDWPSGISHHEFKNSK